MNMEIRTPPPAYTTDYGGKTEPNWATAPNTTSQSVIERMMEHGDRLDAIKRRLEQMQDRVFGPTPLNMDGSKDEDRIPNLMFQMDRANAATRLIFDVIEQLERAI